MGRGRSVGLGRSRVGVKVLGEGWGEFTAVGGAQGQCGGGAQLGPGGGITPPPLLGCGLGLLTFPEKAEREAGAGGGGVTLQ